MEEGRQSADSDTRPRLKPVLQQSALWVYKLGLKRDTTGQLLAQCRLPSPLRHFRCLCRVLLSAAKWHIRAGREHRLSLPLAEVRIQTQVYMQINRNTMVPTSLSVLINT